MPLKPSDGAGAYVKDFRKSKAPQFKGKSDKKKQQMAIAAYLDDKDDQKESTMDKFKKHVMYDPKTGKGYIAKKKADHERMDKMGYTHEKPSVKESISQTLAETIKLGEGVIEEELCPKGKAYIKRRKAAGEKSSAYLSGRAVKVCKGQMSGRKKRKSKKK